MGQLDRWVLTLHDVALPLVTPFRTSLGVETHKRALVLELDTPFGTGWSECSADPEPTYGPEFLEGAGLLIRHVLLPRVAASGARTGQDARAAMSVVPGNPLARSAVEMAVLDAQGRAQGQSLATLLGGSRRQIEVGVSLGIPAGIPDGVDGPDLGTLMALVHQHVDEGYRRIKLKVRPGWDVVPVEAVREEFGPGLVLSVDANQGYDWHRDDDVDRLRRLDEAGLLMIEQPFHRDDLVSHARLGEVLATPICLDESIESVGDADAALTLGACRILNIKPARVGGYLEARAVHDLAVAHGIPVWCGGMLETGLARHANMALASLPGFTLAGDISGTARYFDEDITAAVRPVDGLLAVPEGPGLGTAIDRDALRHVTRSSTTVTITVTTDERGTRTAQS